jgi:glycerophosphoryl diester phosphodiesterase
LLKEEYTQTRNGTSYSGHICTVAEYLAICVEKGVFPVIELKWTTGINNNDMSNFDGLAHLVIDQGLADKVIFLTSMKKSQEYIAEHYPQFTRQWLCNANWEGNEQWCLQYGLHPSISIGNFDAATVRMFHGMGLNVAMWTVDSKANYLKYGNMGVYMMTCNSLKPDEMPELEDIDWGTDGLDQPQTDAVTVDATDRYTITGQSVGRNNPAGGMYIAVKHLSDGTIQTDKILER